MFASPLFKESIRDTGGFCSVLLMAVIISKVTNAINMESRLLITQLALGLSSACFNLHNHSLDKQSFNHHTALYRDTQYSNQPIYRLSDWTPGHSEIQFMLPQWCNGQRRAFQWALNQSECKTKPQQYTWKCAAQFDFLWSSADNKHTGNSQQHMFALSLHRLIININDSCKFVHMPTRAHKRKTRSLDWLPCLVIHITQHLKWRQLQDIELQMTMQQNF